MTVSKIQVKNLGKVLTSLADWAALAFMASDDPLWRMEQDGYQAALEHEVESHFAISNGLLGVRASLEDPTIASRPRTFIAGLFDAPPARYHEVLPRWMREGQPLGRRGDSKPRQGR